MRTLGGIMARVATSVATLAVLCLVVFWVTEVLPGDAVGVLSGPDATAQERADVRIALGLDRPATERFVPWTLSALSGDLGTSLVSGREVSSIVAARLLTSLAMVLPAALLILLLAGVLGTLAGMHAGSGMDRVLSGATMTLISIPDFLIATLLLLLFSVWLPLLPAVAIVPSGESIWQHPELTALPALALALGGFGATMRMLRASISATAAAPFAEFARLNGVRGLRFARLVIVDAAPPALQTLAVMTAGLLGGSIVVESLFNVPGIGSELATAVGNRDVPLIQGLSLALGGGILLILLAGDLFSQLLRRHRTRAEPR